MKAIIATSNPGKLKEFLKLSSKEPWLSLELVKDFSPNETGSTFFENAKIKAILAAKSQGLIAIADDSGLVVEALNGRPGIYSARYAQSDADCRAKLLKEMEHVPVEKRQAAFVCAMVVAKPDGTIAFNTMRFWEGMISFEQKGNHGFGYDSIFYLPKYNLTAAELNSEQKNKISHRSQAWHQVIEYLRKIKG